MVYPGQPYVHNNLFFSQGQYSNEVHIILSFILLGKIFYLYCFSVTS